MPCRRWMGPAALVVLVALLGGCGVPSLAGDEGDDRLHQQALDALSRYDKAVLEAGGQQAFAPVGDLTGQVGDWEFDNGDYKLSLLEGRVVAAGDLPGPAQPTGEVVWENGKTLTVPLVAATTALDQLAAAGNGKCPECKPLEVTGARLTTMKIQTTRGAATAPAWEYTIKNTAVRITRLAVNSASAVKVTPPSWDPNNAPGGLAIESATTTVAGTKLTVAFTGSPQPASEPCGIDYTGTAVESDNAVVVIVLAHPHAVGEMCNSIGARRTTTVDLAKPLGERAVLDVQQGLPVPVNITN